MKLTYIFYLISAGLIILLACSTNAEQEGIAEIPQESAEPFYTGTIEVVQMPTANDLNRDIVLRLNITYLKDSTETWPKTYYGNQPFPKIPVNAVEVDWSPFGYYCPGDTLSSADCEIVETLQVIPRSLSWIRLPSDKDTVNESYEITFPASQYNNLALQNEYGNLNLRIAISFKGGEIPDNPTQRDLLYRFNHSSREIVLFIPATESVTNLSVGSRENPALTIIK